MDHDAQKNYFELAYRTGSDVWTHVPYAKTALSMLPPVPKDSFVLDLGSGRGLWLMRLVEEGYRVIGVDYVAEIVRHGNRDIKLHGIADRARFVHGDVRDLPLADGSFDAVTDVGVLQHLDPADRATYASELRRVTKSGGYVLNVSLSKETQRFLGFRPKASDESRFEKFGVSYSFFMPEELDGIFLPRGFTLVDRKTEAFDARTDPGDSMVFLFSLYRAG